MNVTETLQRGSDGEGVDWTALVASVLVCELAGIVPSILTADEVATWFPDLPLPEMDFDTDGALMLAEPITRAD